MAYHGNLIGHPHSALHLPFLEGRVQDVRILTGRLCAAGGPLPQKADCESPGRSRGITASAQQVAPRRWVQAGSPTWIPQQPLGTGRRLIGTDSSTTIGALRAVATHTQPEVGFLSAPVFQESCD